MRHLLPSLALAAPLACATPAASPAPVATTQPATPEPVVAVVDDARTPSITDPEAPLPPPFPAVGIPPRPADAPTGSAFLAATASLSIAEREQRILHELLRGNVPAFIRRFVPVRVTGLTERGLVYRGVVFVLPDYLAIGDDKDYVRIPMTPVTAQKIADRYGAMLPTSAIVSAVYDGAAVRVAPHPMTPGPAMRSNDYYRRHEAFVESQLAAIPGAKGQLVAGHKKDVVLANRIEHLPQRVAIYGWHTASGEPIQPLSGWHKKSYADYSHGVRLVHPIAYAEGDVWPLADLLRHPTLSLMVSYEGPLRQLRINLDEPQWDSKELAPPIVAAAGGASD